MSEPRISLESVDAVSAGEHVDGEAVDRDAVDILARELEYAPCWPVTRLVNACLTLTLGVAVFAPIAVARATSLIDAVLILPAVIATLISRALFESLVAARPGRGVRGHLLGAVPAAVAAAAIMAGAAAVIGSRADAVAVTLSLVFALATLLLAGAARDVEIRVRLRLRRVYFIGAHRSRDDLGRELSRRRDARLVGSAAVGGPADRAPLTETIRQARATVLVLDHTAMQSPHLVEVAATLNREGVHVRDLVSYYESEFKKVPLVELSPTWFLFEIAPIHRRVADQVIRRTLEFLLAGVLMLCALPVLAIAAAAIALNDGGPILYRQQRVGKGGVPFTMIKLRTMTSTDGGEAAWAGSQERRITAVGRILRRYRIDELPQLVNVLRGDLALIGPRPEQVPIVERLDRELPHYSARHAIRPGITGWAQVNLGYAGSVEGTMAKLQRDLYYLKHSSLRLDGLIVWLTIKTVIASRG